MTETLYFPNLGLEFELNRIAFTIGSFPIYWYGITFALAFLAGFTYFHYNCKKVGVHQNTGFDILFIAVLGGLVGARLYFVIFQWEALYADNPIKIFAVREGGLAIYGGVIGAILAGYFACKFKKTPLLPLLDIGMPALLLGQAIGRWGNFFNIEAFGSNTTLPWGMTSNSIATYLSRVDIVENLAVLGQISDPTIPVHPTFFYEFIWNLIGFAILTLLIFPRRKYDGQVMLCYMVWYGLGRGFIEGLRTDSLVFTTFMGTYRASQLLGFILCILGVAALVVFGKKYKETPAPSWATLYYLTPESIAAIELEESSIAKTDKKNNDPQQAEMESSTADNQYEDDSEDYQQQVEEYPEAQYDDYTDEQQGDDEQDQQYQDSYQEQYVENYVEDTVYDEYDQDGNFLGEDESFFDSEYNDEYGEMLLDETAENTEETETVLEDLAETPEEIETSPEDLTETSEETETSPEDLTETSEETETSPEDLTETSEETETSPEEVTESPEETETAPEKVTESPEETETAPEKVTEIPEETETSPEDLTETPEETETSPEDSSKNPTGKNNGSKRNRKKRRRK